MRHTKTLPRTRDVIDWTLVLLALTALWFAGSRF